MSIATANPKGTMPKLTERGERIVEALRASTPTPVPNADSVVWPCAKFALLWVVSVATALLIGFQYDPLHLGVVTANPRLAIAAGVAVAALTSVVCCLKIVAIILQKGRYFRPGEEKFLLASRESAAYMQLGEHDQEVFDATYSWMQEADGVFGRAQLNALLSILGTDLLAVEHQQLLVNLSWRFRSSLVFSVFLFGANVAAARFILPKNLDLISLTTAAVVAALIATPWDVLYQLVRNAAERALRPVV